MDKEETVNSTSLEKEKKDKTNQDKKRIKKLLSEIKKLRGEKEELNDKLLRKTAEFDNYRKRTEREFLDRIQNANERLITELLPVLDDMERFLEHSKQHTNEINSLIEGSELIYKKFISVLEKEGLQPMQSTGEDFDPEKHDALMQTESKDTESGKIIAEHLKGYLLNDKVIRHSQVIVAK